VRANELVNGTYVEPYAGGAGAGIALLITGQVRKIVINDLDPAIYAFWRAVVDSSPDFVKMIREAELSVDEWRRQREVYHTADRRDYLSLGFATFYLNRTNRSGVLNGGPIGGLDQSGDYKIDARFNRDSLIERVRLIGLHSKRITVRQRDGVSIIRQFGTSPGVLIYADPPYFEKAGSLYMNSFKDDDHVALSACLNDLRSAKWLLTYDNASRVAELYANRRREKFTLHYSAHRVRRASEIMVFSDGLIVE